MQAAQDPNRSFTLGSPAWIEHAENEVRTAEDLTDPVQRANRFRSLLDAMRQAEEALSIPPIDHARLNAIVELGALARSVFTDLQAQD